MQCNPGWPGREKSKAMKGEAILWRGPGGKYTEVQKKELNAAKGGGSRGSNGQLHQRLPQTCKTEFLSENENSGFVTFMFDPCPVHCTHQHTDWVSQDRNRATQELEKVFKLFQTFADDRAGSSGHMPVLCFYLYLTLHLFLHFPTLADECEGSSGQMPSCAATRLTLHATYPTHHPHLSSALASLSSSSSSSSSSSPKHIQNGLELCTNCRNGMETSWKMREKETKYFSKIFARSQNILRENFGKAGADFYCNSRYSSCFIY